MECYNMVSQTEANLFGFICLVLTILVSCFVGFTSYEYGIRKQKKKQLQDLYFHNDLGRVKVELYKSRKVEISFVDEKEIA